MSGIRTSRPSDNPKIRDFIDTWVSYAKEESTREDYRRVGRFFIEYFGERRIGSLCTEDYYEFTRWITSRKKPKGGVYSATYVRKIVTQLYQMTNLAVELGHLDKSPGPKMKRLTFLPKAPKPRKVRLSGEQVRSLIAAAPPSWEDFFRIALVTGARRGELFAMTYGSVDWVARTIAVSCQITEKGEVGSTKTPAGVRTIALPDGILENLANRMSAVGASADDLIFPNVLGGPMSYPNFYRRVWIPTVKAAGLEGLHLHDIRKAFASRMVADGRTPSYLEEVMGHMSFSTTMKYYASTPEEEADLARNGLDDWLAEEERTARYGTRAA